MARDGTPNNETTNHQKPPASSRLVELGGFEPPTFCLPDYRMGDTESALGVQTDATPTLDQPHVENNPQGLIACGCGCGQLIPARDRKGRVRRFVAGHHIRASAAARVKIAEAKRGALNPQWKGGVRRNGGYILELCHAHPAADRWGYVAQHRLIMERLLRRLLAPGEVVHHLDGNRSNNDPSNLWLLSASEHHRLHNRMRPKFYRLPRRISVVQEAQS